MKKLLFAVFILMLSSQLKAQIRKGEWLIGGSISFNSFSSTHSAIEGSTNFSLSPDAGYFFIDKLAGGLNVIFSSSSQKGSDFSSSNFNIAPFLRYYFLPTENKINVFAQGQYGFGSTSSSSPYGPSNTQSSNLYAFSAGPAFFLSPHTALELTLNYISMGGEAFQTMNGESYRLNDFGVNLGFQIHLGK